MTSTMSRGDSVFVDAQGLGNEGTMVQFVGVQGLQHGNLGFQDLGQQGLGDFVVGAGQHFAGLAVHQVSGQHASQHEFAIHQQFLDTGRFQVADVLGGDALVLGDDDLAILAVDIELGGLALQALGTQFELDALLAEVEGIGLVEHLQDLLQVVTQGLEQDA
jgi:hypothetical protein